MSPMPRGEPRLGTLLPRVRRDAPRGLRRLRSRPRAGEQVLRWVRDAAGRRPERGAAAARFSTPEAYTPKHLAERILTSRAALEGERKQVTVLFVDVSGFTALS